MSNKVFIVLVIILSLLITISGVWLIMSISTYKQISYPNEKPSILEDNVVNNSTNDTSNDASNGIDITYVNVENNSNVVNDEDLYILPSNTREITLLDINSFDYDKLNKAYNEIFARYGHDFKNNDLKQYFISKSWYKPISGKSVDISELTSLERKNLQLIKARIDEIKG